MNLTQEQFDFFKDLDLDKAIACGEGQVQFDFIHKDRVVVVQPHRTEDADIVVHPPIEDDDGTRVDPTLSLLGIPGTSNVSGPVLLSLLHEAVCNRPISLLKAARLNTPLVTEWPVDVLGSHIRFSYQVGSTTYELQVHEAQEIQGTVVVELMVDGKRVHTFLLPMGYRKPTAQSVLTLANAITGAWCDEVRGARHE